MFFVTLLAHLRIEYSNEFPIAFQCFILGKYQFLGFHYGHYRRKNKHGAPS
jgi:hypothetical protein